MFRKLNDITINENRIAALQSLLKIRELSQKCSPNIAQQIKQSVDTILNVMFHLVPVNAEHLKIVADLGVRTGKSDDILPVMKHLVQMGVQFTQKDIEYFANLNLKEVAALLRNTIASSVNRIPLLLNSMQQEDDLSFKFISCLSLCLAFHAICDYDYHHKKYLNSAVSSLNNYISDLWKKIPEEKDLTQPSEQNSFIYFPH